MICATRRKTKLLSDKKKIGLQILERLAGKSILRDGKGKMDLK